MASEEIPDFDIDPEMEELLTANLGELDEDTLQDLQLYKSRKLQAKRDAGMESSKPDWWDDNPAPETVEQTGAEGVSRDVPESSESEESTEQETEEASAEEESEAEQEVTEEESTAEETEPEPETEETEEEQTVAEEETDTEEEETPAEEDTEEKDTQEEAEDEEEESPVPDKKAPPPTDTDRYRGERKIGDVVGSRQGGREVSRRGFISSFGLGVAGVLAGFATGGVGAVRFFFPNVLSNPPEQFVAGEPTDYPQNTVSDKFKSNYRVWIVNLSDRIVAISAICTHLGCTPNWISSQGIFKCPCHGSAYYMNGVNFAGPAPRPMNRVAIRLNPQGKIVVDKSKTFAANGTPGWNAEQAYLAV